MDNIELNNTFFGKSSLSIILRQYKKEAISEEEAIQLIGDLYNIYTYIPTSPLIYQEPKIQPYTITCKIHD